MFTALLALLALGTPPDPFKPDTSTVDLGEVKAGPVLTRRFAFVNAGTEPLTVTDLKASCGCATSTLEKRTYRPGERGEVTLEVNTLGQAEGPQRWTLGVGYKCGDSIGTMTLEVTARLVRDIRVDPVALHFHGAGQTHDIHISAARPAHSNDLQITNVRTSSERLQVKWVLGTSDTRGLTDESVTYLYWWFQVSIADTCPEGMHSEAIWFDTNDSKCPSLKVPVTIVVKPKRQVTASPAAVTLVAGGSVLVQLRDADGKAVSVEKAEPSHPALTCRWTAGPGNLATLRVGLDRARWTGGDMSGEMKVTANGQTVLIPVSVRKSD